MVGERETVRGIESLLTFRFVRFLMVDASFQSETYLTRGIVAIIWRGIDQLSRRVQVSIWRVKQTTRT